MKQTPRKPGKKYNLFLSHSGAHREWVVQLAQRLRIEGLRPFLNKWNKRPQDLSRKLSEWAAEESDGCLVIVGDDGFGPWATGAISATVTRDRDFSVLLILPPGVEPAPLPAILRGAEQIRFQSDDDPEALHRLLEALRGDGPARTGDDRTAAIPLEMGGHKHPPGAMSRKRAVGPRVFISYSHDSSDHREQILALANRLRADGVDARLDRFEEAPPEGWQEWMVRQVERADRVLVVCTETYYLRYRKLAPKGVGRGVKWEGAIITQALYEGDGLNEKFIPLLPDGGSTEHIPTSLRETTFYRFQKDDDYTALLRRLTGQPETPLPPLGAIPELPPVATAHLPTRPLPQPEEWAQRWIRQQQELRARLKQETLAGQDTTATHAALQEVKGRLRDGPMPTTGEYLKDRYELLELIGEGGFAHVWRAWDEEEDRIVAVKILHGQYARSESRLRRFKRGARRMKALRHPGIVEVLADYEQDDHFHFFVMEYLDGGDLQHAIREGRIGPQEGMGILHTVGQALHFAHQQNIIHRDIKPANILLSATGEAKLTDFDLVRALHSAGGTRTATLGTVIYAAPEAMLNAKVADLRADIYGLAMTAAFILHGQEELPAIVFRNPEGLIRALEVPKATQEVLCRAVAFDPDDRFNTVTAFLEALDQATREPDQQTATETRQGARGRKEGSPLDPIREILKAHGVDPSKLQVTNALPALLERSLPTVDEPNRPRCALAIAEAWPQTTDLTDLGILAWSLDYFTLRDPDHAREALRRREQLLVPLRDRHSSPRLKEWIDIPAGHFLMGSPPEEEVDSDERPQHRVDLSAFQILDHPITNRDYRHLVPNHGEDNDLPAVNLSWYEAYAYASWLGGRLPTEAEWEYSCRAGSTARYCNGDKESDLDRVGWYAANSGRRLHPVKQKEPNAWGLYDMHGNAWEWVADWKGSYSADQRQDPPGPPSGEFRVFRGGCFRNSAHGARSAFRDSRNPWFRWQVQGFRVVVPVAPSS